MYYRAWLVLKDHTSFRPPTPKAAIDLEKDDDDEEMESDDEIPVAVTLSYDVSPPINQCDSDLLNISSMKKASRGPGPGSQAKYRKEKMERIDMLVSEAKSF
jgi:hypothetical protein